MDKVIWQFATANDLTGLLIRYGTRSDWSHVDAILPDGSLIGARIEGGVQVRKPGSVKFSSTLKVAIKTDYADKVYDLLQSQVGKPYDCRAIVAFGLGDRDWRALDSWFCSEIQIWAMEQAGFFGHDLIIPFTRLSPRDQLLLFSPWIELID